MKEKNLEKTYARFVLSVANQYKDRGLTVKELIATGEDGLRKAAKRGSASIWVVTDHYNF